MIFVVEGSGYDLHWDMKFDCLDAFKWEWADVPKKFEWKRGDYIYIPPFTTHQHFAAERGAADHDEQPHRQGDGLRLVRPGGARAGILIRQLAAQPDAASAVGMTLDRRDASHAVLCAATECMRVAS